MNLGARGVHDCCILRRVPGGWAVEPWAKSAPGRGGRLARTLRSIARRARRLLPLATAFAAGAVTSALLLGWRLGVYL